MSPADPPALLDANAFVRIARVGDPERATCERLLAVADEDRLRLTTCAQTFIEFWAVATRPTGPENGLGLSPGLADEFVRRFELQLPPLDEPPQVFTAWHDLAARYAVKGKTTHDARLVAVAWSYGIRRVVTLNPKHFRRYSEVTPVAPADLLAEVGA